MAKMTAWLDEKVMSFKTAEEIKVEVENLLNQFEEHKAKLSQAEQSVLEKYQAQFDYDMYHLPSKASMDKDHNRGFVDFAFLKSGVANIEKQYNEDVTSHDENWAEVDNGRTYSEYVIKERKEYIQECAVFVRYMETFKDNFLQEINDAQIEKPELAATKETVVAEPKAAAPVISKPVGTYHAAKAIAKSVCQTVKKAVVGTYHAVKAVVVNVIDTVKTNIEDMIAKMKKAVAVIVA